MHITKKVKQVYTIGEETLLDVSEKQLVVRVGNRHFGYAITDTTAATLYQLAWYTGEDMSKGRIAAIIASYPLLKQQFKKIHIGYDFGKSLLVPLGEGAEQDDLALLRAMFGTGGKEMAIREVVTGWDIHNVYATPADIHHVLQQAFPVNNYWHGYTVNTKGLNMANAAAFYVEVREEEFVLIVLKANELLLTQTYSYAAPADILYFLLQACQQFSLTQQDTKLVLSGLVTQESALFKDLYQYFIDICFREADWLFPSGQTSYPPHFFTSLNDLARCGS